MVRSDADPQTSLSLISEQVFSDQATIVNNIKIS